MINNIHKQRPSIYNENIKITQINLEKLKELSNDKNKSQTLVNVQI